MSGRTEASELPHRATRSVLVASRVFWLALGIIVTMATMLATARLDRLDRPSVWGYGPVILAMVAVPAVCFWSDLLYRSVAIVWTVLVAVAFVATFGYFWWPLTMVPFVWVAFFRPRQTSITGSGLLLVGAVALGAIALPLTSSVIPPLEGGAFIVCLAADAPQQTSNQVMKALFSVTTKDASGEATMHGGRPVIIIEPDRYASTAHRDSIVEAAHALPQVVDVVQVPKSPWSGGSYDDPCR